jgi:hypothetical protein
MSVTRRSAAFDVEALRGRALRVLGVPTRDVHGCRAMLDGEIVYLACLFTGRRARCEALPLREFIRREYENGADFYDLVDAWGRAVVDSLIGSDR